MGQDAVATNLLRTVPKSLVRAPSRHTHMQLKKSVPIFEDLNGRGQQQCGGG